MKKELMFPILICLFVGAVGGVQEVRGEEETLPLNSHLLPEEYYQSVVRLEVASQTPDYQSPWNAGNFRSGSGSGFKVGDNLYMTNAHVVSNSQRIIVRKHGDPGVYQAKVVHIAHDCDLALIELEDDSAFADVPALNFGGLPQLESEVRAIGYPIGGERISVTRGVVSRIDFSTYSHSAIDQHLVIQIDAAINPGNSGGPVMQGDKVVGVAFQALRAADNTGYMIPTPVVQRFLEDVESGTYDHYVDLAIGEFNLINTTQREALGLPDDGRGILISDVLPGGSVDGVLEPGDVLLGLDEFPVYANGQVMIDGEMVAMHEIVERKFAGDTVLLTFLRDGEEMEAEAELYQFGPARIFEIEYDRRPQFAMVGGLVFQPLSRNLIFAHRLSGLEMRMFIGNYLQRHMFIEWPEVILLTSVLPDEINADVVGFSGSIVDTINGRKIRSMQDVKEVLVAPLEEGDLPEFIDIRCLGTERPIILEGERLVEAQERIAGRYNVQPQYYIEVPPEVEEKEDVAGR